MPPQAEASELSAIQALPYEAAANPDAGRLGPLVDTVLVEDFANGLSTWDLDAINVTDFGFSNRHIKEVGIGEWWVIRRMI